MGLLHIAIFSLYQIFIFYDDILLLECLSHCTKILTQSQYKDILLKVQKLSVFSLRLCFAYKKVQWFIVWTYAFERNYYLQMNKIERQSLMVLRGREIFLSYFHKVPCSVQFNPQWNKASSYQSPVEVVQFLRIPQ